jgi:hypothetical protein
MTQAGRSRARAIVIVRGDEAAIRRKGARDEAVPLGEVVATLCK